MKLFLTGGAGYIGSHCALEALRQGHEVVIFDNFCTSDPAQVSRLAFEAGRSVEVVRGDVRNYRDLILALTEYQPDVVLHFAGLKSVEESVLRPLFYYDNNVVGTLQLLKAMECADVKRVVFSSSATVYGEPQYLPIDESHPLSTTNPYGESKLVAEGVLNGVCAADGEVSAAILRYFNPVGADFSGAIGEVSSQKPANLMPVVAKVAAGELGCVNIFGDDYDTRDGTGVRDYIHVSDLAEAHLAAIDWVMQNTGAHCFNLGNGTGTTVREMVEAFERSSDRQIPISIKRRRPGDVGSCFADPSKAGRDLGWKARRGIQEMCDSAWMWQVRSSVTA